MGFTQYNDFDDFINKMGFTHKEGIIFLDNEIKKLGGEHGDKTRGIKKI